MQTLVLQIFAVWVATEDLAKKPLAAIIESEKEILKVKGLLDLYAQSIKEMQNQTKYAPDSIEVFLFFGQKR